MICQRTLTFLVIIQLVVTSICRTVESLPVEHSDVGLKSVLNDDAKVANEIGTESSIVEDDFSLSLPADEQLHTLDGKVVEENQAKSLFQSMGAFVKNKIAPAASYVTLVNRYHKWFQNYKALKKVSKRQLPDATDILKAEYTKVESILIEEELAKQAEEEELKKQAAEEDLEKFTDEYDLEKQSSEGSNSNLVEDQGEQVDKRLKKIENMDFVFKAMKLLIDRLESILKRLEEQEGIEVETDENELLGESVDQESIKRSMERVRRSVMSAAKNVLTGELTIIARTAVFNGLAQMMAAKPDTGDALDQLRPIIALLGSATTPLAVSYLSSIEFRAGLAVANTFNPLAHYMDKVKAKKESEQKVQGEV